MKAEDTVRLCPLVGGFRVNCDIKCHERQAELSFKAGTRVIIDLLYKWSNQPFNHDDFVRELNEMGIDWMNREELTQAIPPAYTEYIGKQLIRAQSNGYVREHILVWEQTHGQPLPEGWAVHHLNGIKDDNRAENLAAMSKSGHTRSEMAEAYKNRIRELEAKLMDRCRASGQDVNDEIVKRLVDVK